MGKGKYFTEDKDNWQYNSRILKGDVGWLFRQEGFKATTEMIEQQILGEDRSKQDFFIYPYCFNMRHYIELSLKEIIDEGCKLAYSAVNPAEGRHNLSKLLKTAQEVLKDVWGNDSRNPPENVSDFINELQSIDEKSDGFRYPVNTNGHNTLDGIDWMNFQTIADGFQEPKDYLTGMIDELAVAMDSVSEAHSFQ